MKTVVGKTQKLFFSSSPLLYRNLSRENLDRSLDRALSINFHATFSLSTRATFPCLKAIHVKCEQFKIAGHLLTLPTSLNLPPNETTAALVKKVARNLRTLRWEIQTSVQNFQNDFVLKKKKLRKLHNDKTLSFEFWREFQVGDRIKIEIQIMAGYLK